MTGSDQYEVFAVRYATRGQRKRLESFIMADDHDGPMPIDYFVWAVTNNERTIIVDTGFDHAEAKLRNRVLTRLPREGLAMLEIDASTVKDVVVTHLHYDHAGTTDHFPQARFHLQEKEMRFTTGRHMCQHLFSHAFAPEHVCKMVEHLYKGRLAFHDGDEEIAPGVSVHLIGGHTMGIQCVRVNTARGPVLLASDATHFYENFEKTSPFPIVYSVADMVAGYDKMRKLAASPKHIIPGHDPLVMQRYPTPRKALEGVVVRLDVAPAG